MQDKLLSVIVPCYRAEHMINNFLNNLHRQLLNTNEKFEIICVIDGFVDNSYQIAENFASRFSSTVKVYGYKNNKGKGYAVRFGLNMARGENVAYLDVGRDLRISEFCKLYKRHIKGNYDISYGSKNHPKSKVNRTVIRKIMSSVYQIIVSILFSLNISDTQVGMKIIRREIVNVIRKKLKENSFVFDVELLYFANKYGFHNYLEYPITINQKITRDSTIMSSGLLITAFQMFVDLLILFKRCVLRGKG